MGWPLYADDDRPEREISMEKKWYGYVFEDNTYIISKKLSKGQIEIEEKKHGRLLEIE